jgi:hypothetical protein
MGNLDVVEEGFAATYTENEANKHVEDFGVTASQIVEMLLCNMS